MLQHNLLPTFAERCEINHCLSVLYWIINILTCIVLFFCSTAVHRNRKENSMSITHSGATSSGMKELIGVHNATKRHLEVEPHCHVSVRCLAVSLQLC